MPRILNERTNERTNDMTIPAHIAQTLTDLRLRREYIDQAIHMLSSIWENQPAPPAAVPATPAPAATSRRLKPAEPRQARGGEKSGDDHSATILNALRKTVRPVSVGELKRETKLSSYLLNNRLTAMSAKRLVVISGKTNAKRISLPGTTPAKEEP